jgi:hypothetical protein
LENVFEPLHLSLGRGTNDNLTEVTRGSEVRDPHTYDVDARFGSRSSRTANEKGTMANVVFPELKIASLCQSRHLLPLPSYCAIGLRGELHHWLTARVKWKKPLPRQVRGRANTGTMAVMLDQDDYGAIGVSRTILDWRSE